jgi:hypothetical protein
MTTWPPTLTQLKTDAKIDVADTRFDSLLTECLNAAIAYVERVRTDVNFDDESGTTAPPTPVTDDLVLGTLRYARRLVYRADTPGGNIVVDGIGASPIPGWDADIEKLLRIGRYAKLRFA